MADLPAAPNSPPWSRTTRIIVIVVVLVILLALIILAWPLFQALVIAGLLAYLLEPLVVWCERRLHLRRFWAAVLVFVFVMLVAASIPALIGTLVYSWFSELSARFTTVLQEIKTWLSQPIIILGFDLSPRGLVENLGRSAGSAITSFSGGSQSIISGITTNILAVLVVLASLYYLLRDGQKVRPWFEDLFLPDYRPEVARLLTEINIVWRIFLRAQILIFLVLAILMVIGAVLVIWLYTLDLIPISTLGLIGILILVYALVQQVDNLWLRPQLLGHHLQIHPGVVFVGLVVGLAVANILGALLAVPLIATAKILWRYIQHKISGTDPWQADENSSMLAPIAHQDDS